MWHSILHLLREMKGCIRHSIVLSRGISKRCRPLLEQLESRETPSGSPVLVAASYADKSIYALDPVSGKMLATLVAPNSSPLLQAPTGVARGPDGNLYISDFKTTSILKYNWSTNTLSTFISAADFQGVSGNPSKPCDLVFGPDGNLCVTNLVWGNFGGAIVRFKLTDTAGTLTYSGSSTIIDSGDQPYKLAFGTAPGDTQNLYYTTNYPSFAVVKIPNITSSIAPRFFYSLGANGRGDLPGGIAFGPDGNLYVGAMYQSTLVTTTGHIDQIGSNGISFSRLLPGPDSAGHNVYFGFPPQAIIFDGLGHVLVGNGNNDGPDVFTGQSVPPGDIFQFELNGTYDQTFVVSGAGTSPSFTPSSMVLFPSLQIPASPTVTHFAITTSASSITAGGTVDVTLTAEDSQNNPVPSYTGSVQLSSTDTNAVWNSAGLPASYTFTTADAGSHSFSVTLTTAGLTIDYGR